MPTIEQAKRIIAAGSLEGARALGAGISKPVLQLRYNIAARAALSDDAATFTPEERRTVAMFIDEGDEETRDYTLRVRLTPQEQEQLEGAANGLGMTVSEYVRRKLFAREGQEG